VVGSGSESIGLSGLCLGLAGDDSGTVNGIASSIAVIAIVSCAGWWARVHVSGAMRLISRGQWSKE